jgi:hypothetical protein
MNTKIKLPKEEENWLKYLVYRIHNMNPAFDRVVEQEIKKTRERWKDMLGWDVPDDDIHWNDANFEDVEPIIWNFFSEELQQMYSRGFIAGNLKGQELGVKDERKKLITTFLKGGYVKSKRTGLTYQMPKEYDTLVIRDAQTNEVLEETK